MVPHNTNEIVLYRPDAAVSLEVIVEDNTVWLKQAQMVELFQSGKANVSEHIKHIFEENELVKNVVVRKFRTVQEEKIDFFVRTALPLSQFLS